MIDKQYSQGAPWNFFHIVSMGAVVLFRRGFGVDYLRGFVGFLGLVTFSMFISTVIEFILSPRSGLLHAIFNFSCIVKGLSLGAYIIHLAIAHAELTPLARQRRKTDPSFSGVSWLGFLPLEEWQLHWFVEPGITFALGFLFLTQSIFLGCTTLFVATVFFFKEWRNFYVREIPPIRVKQDLKIQMDATGSVDDANLQPPPANSALPETFSPPTFPDLDTAPSKPHLAAETWDRLPASAPVEEARLPESTRPIHHLPEYERERRYLYLLGLPESASVDLETVKRSYRQKMLIYHSDRSSQSPHMDDEERHEMLIYLNAAMKHFENKLEPGVNKPQRGTN